MKKKKNPLQTLRFYAEDSQLGTIIEKQNQ